MTFIVFLLFLYPQCFLAPVSPVSMPTLWSSAPWRENVILWSIFLFYLITLPQSFWNNPFASASVVYKICYEHPNTHSTPFLCVYFLFTFQNSKDTEGKSVKYLWNVFPLVLYPRRPPPLSQDKSMSSVAFHMHVKRTFSLFPHQA